MFVAVVPSGEWFPEKGDTTLLAGRLAAANGKPGVYVVMDGDRSYGVAHQLGAYAPTWTYADGDEALSRAALGVPRRPAGVDVQHAEAGPDRAAAARAGGLGPEWRSSPSARRSRTASAAPSSACWAAACSAGIVLGVAAIGRPTTGGTRVKARFLLTCLAAVLTLLGCGSGRGWYGADSGGAGARDRDRVDEGPGLHRPGVQDGAAREAAGRRAYEGEGARVPGLHGRPAADAERRVPGQGEHVTHPGHGRAPASPGCTSWWTAAAASRGTRRRTCRRSARTSCRRRGRARWTTPGTTRGRPRCWPGCTSCLRDQASRRPRNRPQSGRPSAWHLGAERSRVDRRAVDRRRTRRPGRSGSADRSAPPGFGGPESVQIPPHVAATVAAERRRRLTQETNAELTRLGSELAALPTTEGAGLVHQQAALDDHAAASKVLDSSPRPRRPGRRDGAAGQGSAGVRRRGRRSQPTGRWTPYRSCARSTRCTVARPVGRPRWSRTAPR